MVGRWTYGKLYMAKKKARLVSTIDRVANRYWEQRLRRTWNDVASIHSILILDESETVHKLHFGNLSGAVGRKVSLDIGLGS